MSKIGNSFLHTLSLAIPLATVLLFSQGAQAAGACCAHGAAKKDASCTTKENGGACKTILFFMNPNGRPCQMQDEILTGIKDSLAGCATIKYIKTTEDADRAAFSTYGIRGLPSLIVLNKSGKEEKRFTPGVQDASTILAAVKGNCHHD